MIIWKDMRRDQFQDTSKTISIGKIFKYGMYEPIIPAYMWTSFFFIFPSSLQFHYTIPRGGFYNKRYFAILHC